MMNRSMIQRLLVCAACFVLISANAVGTVSLARAEGISTIVAVETIAPAAEVNAVETATPQATGTLVPEIALLQTVAPEVVEALALGTEVPYSTESLAPEIALLQTVAPETPDAESAESSLDTAETEAVPSAADEITLELIPKSDIVFTNVLFHYVYFDAEVHGASKLSLRVLNPEGVQVNFRTRKHVENNISASRSAGYSLKKGQEIYEDLNVYFQRDLTPGLWTIEVTASAAKKASVTQTLTVEIQEPRPLNLTMLEQVHDMMIGTEGGEVIPVEPGKIRYIAQDPRDSLFVKGYWLSKGYDLRPTANQKCTRAIFSMALSYLGIDCTPVRMSDMLKGIDIEYTYDVICEKLGTVRRLEGDLETLWARYQAGEATPVLLHFKHSEGMHALLLVARDEEDPELFYGITPGQRVNTTPWPDGVYRDAVLPILIEHGEKGQRIQSPLLDRYDRGVIDEIWQWEWIDEH